MKDGVPAGGDVFLVLEDQSYNAIRETRTGEDGLYVFSNLQALSEGYNLVFAQEWNTQFEMDEVVSWAWIGPVVVDPGAAMELPDLEISLEGLRAVSPESDDSFSAATIVFEWTAFLEVTTYWVDLTWGEEQDLVWQSDFVQDNSAAFDGALNDGTSIQPGDYWWGVGARRGLGPITLTVYGYLSQLRIEP
jgi:hypothetical protein